MNRSYREYAGTIAALVLGLAVDVALAVADGVHVPWWAYAVITAAAVGIALMLKPSAAPPMTAPEQTRSVIKGSVGHGSEIRRIRTRDADYVIEGDFHGSILEDVNYE